MTETVDFKVSVRAWSQSVSLRPLAERLGPNVGTVYDKGEVTVSGRSTGRTSSAFYLSTRDIEARGGASLDRIVRQQLAFIDADPTLSGLTRLNDSKVTVWVSVFGRTPRETQALGLDLQLFGHGIGLIVDNFTTFDDTGQPKQFEILPHGQPAR